MGDVDAPRPKLARQALRQPADGKLARRKGPEAGRAAHRGRRARDDQGRRVRGRGHRLEQGGERRLREVEEAEAEGGLLETALGEKIGEHSTVKPTRCRSGRPRAPPRTLPERA